MKGYSNKEMKISRKVSNSSWKEKGKTKNKVEVEKTKSKRQKNNEKL